MVSIIIPKTILNDGSQELLQKPNDREILAKSFYIRRNLLTDLKACYVRFKKLQLNVNFVVWSLNVYM